MKQNLRDTGSRRKRIFRRDSVFSSPYTFSAKERDLETGYSYFGARYYNATLSVWLSVDPLAKPHESVYAAFANNPIGVVDPDGRDTIDIHKINDKWTVTSTQIVKGDDVFRVHTNGADPQTFTFSEGEYGNRINYLRLEEDEKQTFGIYHLSGTETTGYEIEREGPSTYAANTGRRIPANSYRLMYGEDEGARWRGYPLIYNDRLSKGRGVKIHYGTDRNWSTGCLIVSSDYTIQKGLYKFDRGESEAASWRLNQYLGAESRDVNYRTKEKNPRNYHRYIYNNTSRINNSRLNIQELWAK